MGQALPGVADAAVHLDGGLTDGAGRLGAVHLGDPGRLQRLGRPQLVDGPGGVAQDRLRPLDERQALGQQVRDRLVGPDGVAVLLADLGVLDCQGVRAASRADQLGGRGDDREGLPAGRVRGGDLPGRLERAAERRGDPGEVDASLRLPHRGRQQARAVQGQRPRGAPGVDGQVGHGHRGWLASQPQGAGRAQGIGQDPPEERDVHCPPGQFLGDEGDLNSAGAVGAQRAPAGRRDGLLQPRLALGVGQVKHRVRPEIVGEPRRRLAKLGLLSR